MEKIKWVNHASFIFEYKDVKLICDPWLEGAVFNDGWKHLVQSEFSYTDFSNITHIWFSHEHPDHFSPPNIKKIPPEIRANITVLYQVTQDKKVVSFCKQLGFKSVVELMPEIPYLLAKELTLINAPVGNERDSWLCIRTPNFTLLNLNDCAFEKTEKENLADLQKIKKQTGAVKIDILFTQFSYASWAGNKEDVAFRKKCAQHMCNQITWEIAVFNPSFVVPFASYVWFCHEDNFYMNDYPNKIDVIHDFIKSRGAQSVVLFPGDEWDMKSQFNSQFAIDRYLKCSTETVNQNNIIKKPLVTIDELKKSAKYYAQESLKLNHAPRLLQFNPFSFFLNDHQKAFSFSFKDGLKEISLVKDCCDISLSTQALKYCFDYLWGFDTLHISGRFQKPLNGNFLNFQEYQYLSTLNNQGGRIGNKFNSAIKRIKTIFVR